MKICFITNLYQPYKRGGAEKVVETTVNGLSDEHEVIIISTRPFDGFKTLKPERQKSAHCIIYRFFPLNIFYYLNDYKHNVVIRMLWHFLDLLNWHSAGVVKQILKQEKPDVVITHNLKGIGLLIPRQIYKLGIKHLHVLHDVQYAIPSGLIIKKQENNFVTNGFLTRFYQSVCRFLLKKIKIIVSPSQWLIDFYHQKNFFLNAKTYKLPNPVGLNNKIVQGHELRDERNRFLYLGQIEDHKGVVFLLETFKNMPELDLVVAGEGTLLDGLKVKYQTQSNINFKGGLDYRAVQQVLNQTDYLVVPSLCYENSPTVIYESLSAGRPIVASNIGGVAELVTDSQNGYIFKPGDSYDLSRALKKAEHNINYRKMSMNCSERAKELDIKRYIIKLLKIIA